MQSPPPLRVTIWHEYRHEKNNEKVREIYPDGMHEAVAAGLRGRDGLEVRTATLDEPEHGLTDDVLETTDVMTWWGHMAHDDVDDKVAQKVVDRVHAGMGLVVLHSGHFSKPFKKLMGTTCDLKWREADDKEVLHVTAPGHPILQGIDDRFTLANEEMYGEYFDVPEPDETLLISWFTHGEVFRSGMTWRRGKGRVFYFRPGHETYPTYHDETVLKIIRQGVRWVAPVGEVKLPKFGNQKAGWNT